jgi:hypothetical protein
MRVQAHSSAMTRANAIVWRLLLAVVVLLSLPACLVIVSTGPTPVSGATIVFIAKDDGGRSIPALHVSVTGVDRTWRDEGVTAPDGAFRVNVEPGVTRVRAGVELPSGYAIAGDERWPREFDVPPDGQMQVEIRVKAL